MRTPTARARHRQGGEPRTDDLLKPDVAADAESPAATLDELRIDLARRPG